MRSINYLTDRPAKILFSICFPLVGVNLLLWITTTWTNQLYSRYVGADAFAITGYLSAVTTAFANIVSSIMLAAWIKTAHTFALNDKEACSQQIFNGIAAVIPSALQTSSIVSTESCVLRYRGFASVLYGIPLSFEN